MVYTASLALPVANALGKKVMQSNINKICDLISLDPDSSNMDVVILGPNDLPRPRMQKVQNAVANKHPDVCVIYLYCKDSDRDALDTPNKMQVKKISKAVVKEAFDRFVGEHKIHQGKQQVTSADFQPVPTTGVEETPLDVASKKPLFGMRKRKRTEFGDFRHEEETPDDAGVPTDGDITKVDYSEDDFQGEEEQEPSVRIGTDGSPVQSKSKPEPLNIPPIDDSEFTSPEKAEEVEEDTMPDLSKLFAPKPVSKEESVDLGKHDDPVLSQTQASGLAATVAQKSSQEAVPMPSFGTPKREASSVEKPQAPTPTLEDNLANVNNYEDWALLKEKLNHDSITSALIKENSEYIGLMNIINALDNRIETVWRDTALSAEEKFNKIREIGLEKSVVRASQNSMCVQKVISIISTIILSAKRTVDEKVQSIDSSLYKIASDRVTLSDTRDIDALIEERTKVQMDLLAISRDIVDLYAQVEDLVTVELQELDAKLPSASAFINDMVKPIGTQIFTPANTAILANKLMKALQENRVIASELEESVNAVIQQLFNLCERDEEVIHYLQNSVNMLKANNVEEVVIVDTLLKNVLRLYVGADNTGRSATAITWCGILSRRQNSLLIDLTGRSKFREYGITPIDLEEFMSARIEQQFLCVESDHIPDPEELHELVTELKQRLNYYPYVNIIVAPEDIDGLCQLSEEAKCVHYITDCTTSSINTMREVIRNHTTPNVARKLISINTPVSPLMIADSLNIDPTINKLITLPEVRAIRACALRHDRPYEYTDVVKAFEEAFR